MIHQAIHRLMEGNKRFVADKSDMDISESRRIKVAYKQKPFAIVLGCSDSRVSPEIIFDQGLGELFVVRSAAAILDSSIIGTIEFGVQNFQPPLLVVLGHSKCGGVKFALESIQGKPADANEPHYMIEALRPSVERALKEGGDAWNNAARYHIGHSMAQLEKSPVIENAVSRNALRLVRGWYDIATGVVEME